MEFEFRTDITGQPLAKCDLECEAFGDWLSNDYGTQRTKINQLLTLIEKLQQKQILSYSLEGREYYLNFENEEVELYLNHNPHL